MIAYLKGTLTELEPAHVIVDCGGVGYLAKISLQTYQQLKDKPQAKVFTYLQVREDAQVLYGFSEKAEQKLFELLIAISGVGGNTALMILSSLSPQEFYAAISQEDLVALKRIKGIGAKTAGRIILELKDKIQSAADGGGMQGAEGGYRQKKEEAVLALVTLGLPRAAMEKRVEGILKQQPGLNVPEIIKAALKNP